jgi:hypothetical protein
MARKYKSAGGNPNRERAKKKPAVARDMVSTMSTSDTQSKKFVIGSSFRT